MTAYPRIFRIRQHWDQPRIEDVAGAVEAALSDLNLAARIKPGQTVAITAGSRGIANIARVLRAAVKHLKQLGATPVIVPAMGSHGGATPEGQRQLLERYGISESFCGCPIQSSMETVVVCEANEGFPVHFDRVAYEADHVLVCGRVKPHTRFAGDVESGLMKMMLIGLGKQAGALVYHQAIQDYSFGQILRSVAHVVLEKCNIVAGLALVENACEETAHIAGVAPEAFEAREAELLQLARQWMPRIPFDRADVLLVDRIGKDISGSGFDTNVVGRKFLDHAAREDESPKIRYIALRGLTAATAGNATGLGLAEFCRSRILREMDVPATRTNCLTGSHATAAMIPLDYETDREILDVALSISGLTPIAHLGLLWIESTLNITELECSEAYWDEAAGRSDLEILTQPRKLPLGNDGNLPDLAAFWTHEAGCRSE